MATMSFKKGDLFRYTVGSRNGFGVTLDGEKAFIIMGVCGGTGYNTGKGSIPRDAVPLRDNESKTLPFEVQIALQAVVTAIY